MLAHWLEDGLGGGMGLRRFTAGLDNVNSRDRSRLITLSEREREKERLILNIIEAIDNKCKMYLLH